MSVSDEIPRTRRPGREIPKFARRIVNTCIDQGWRYETLPGGHCRLVPPDPDAEMVTFASTASDWRARLNFIAAVKRQGADLSRPPAPRRRRPDPLVGTWPVVESRPRLRDGKNGWDYKPPAPEAPPPPPAPVPDPGDAKGAHHTLEQAMGLLMQGYNVRRVVKVTGWGINWFADKVDQFGYYRRTT